MSNLKDPKSEDKSNDDVLDNIRELLGAMYIQGMRNYDMLSIIADKLGADAKGLSNLHQQGQVLAPPASFIFEQDDDTNDLQESLFEDEA
jgi:hypothetical protein